MLNGKQKILYANWRESLRDFLIHMFSWKYELYATNGLKALSNRMEDTFQNRYKLNSIEQRQGIGQTSLNSLVFQEIFEFSRSGIAIINKDGVFIRTNSSFRTMFGYLENEFDDLTFLEMVVPEELEEFKKELQSFLDGNGKNWELEMHYVRKNGDVIIGSTLMTSLQKGMKEDRLVSILINDVTDQRLIEKQLIESEYELRTLAESAPIHILKINRKSEITFINYAFDGRQRVDLLGTSLFDWIPRKESPKVRRLIERAFETGVSDQCEVMMYTLNRKTAWYSTIIGPIAKNGKIDTLMLLARDITVQKEAIELKERFTRRLEVKVSERTAELERAKLELAKSLEKEKELGELKSRFVATASHQFRTPLTVIKSNIGILSMQRADMGESFVPKFDKAYMRIERQISRMTSLMDDVLILGKINTGNVSCELTPTNLIQLCQEVIANQNEILDKGRRIMFAIQGDPILVNLDGRLMEHVLLNLLSNGLKYSPNHLPPSVSLRFNDTNVQLIVKDKGIGIPEHELKHLFEPFYRASNVAEIAGTGLGSTIIKEYVTLNRGVITVQSELGKGSEFTIEFELDQ